MSPKPVHAYKPDYAVPPGEILAETLAAKGMSQAELALRSGLTPKTISLIVAGKAPVTAETALLFERILDVSAEVWNNLESGYRLFLARQEEKTRMAAHTDWVRKFPLADLRRRGIVSERRVTATTAGEVLAFLGMSAPAAFDSYLDGLRLAARRSAAFASSPFSVACWLRVAELQAQARNCKPFSAERFRGACHALAQLTAETPDAFEPRIVANCADAGVAVAFAGEMQGTHISGATRWLGKDKALLALSLRHKTDDHFWFSFFHEAGHILLHGKREFFLDERNGELDKQEEEANRFAADLLIKPAAWRAFTSQANFQKQNVLSFAREQAVAPGIVVGRLQKEGRIDWSWHNDLKRHIELVETTATEG